jgi:C_GCAxxG_C_C family probable redox protein
MTDVEKAVSLFREGFSCSQAMLGTYGERYGLARDLALKLGDAFGGGMGGLGRTCGAVTGALMVIGLAHGRTAADDMESKRATSHRVQELIVRFETQHGTTVCRDIIGCAIDTPENVRVAREQGNL